MSQTQRIVAATKRALRERGLTYGDVALQLGLSQASVKRLFTRGPFSLERLEAVAGLMGMDLAELVRLAETLTPLPRQMSIEQERHLAERPKLLLVFYLLLHDYQLDRIVEEFRIDRPEGILLLRDLEAIGLVERRLGDRARLRVARDFCWRREGPVRRFIDQRVLREFLHAPFDGADDSFHFVSGLLSPASIARLQADIERLVRRFNDRVHGEGGEELDRRRGCSLLLAMRPWHFSLFSEFQRQSPGYTPEEAQDDFG